MSGHVGNTRSRPGVVKECGVAVEIAWHLFRSKVINASVLAAAMLDFPLPVLPDIA